MKTQVELEHKLSACTGDNCWTKTNNGKLDHVFDTHLDRTCDTAPSDKSQPAKQLLVDAVKELEAKDAVALMERECKDLCLAGAGCRAATLSGTKCTMYSECTTRKEEVGTKTFSAGRSLITGAWEAPSGDKALYDMRVTAFCTLSNLGAEQHDRAHTPTIHGIVLGGKPR